MSITHAHPGAPHAAPLPGWRDYLSFERQRVRPRWLLLTLLTALVYLVMPVVHERVYGPERIRDATVHAVEDVLGTRLSGGAEQAVRAQVDDKPAVADGVQRMVLTVLAVLLAAALLTAGSVLVMAELSAAQALAVTALAFLATALLRVAFWGARTALLGVEAAAAPDWTYVAPGGLSVLAAPGAGHLWRTFLGGLDIYYVIGLLVSVLGLSVMSPRTGLAAALAASAGWMLAVIAFRVAMAAAFGFPIL